MNIETFLSLDATEMATLIQKKEVSAKELMEMAFERLEEVQPILNVATHTRKEKALKEAESLSIENAPFNGVPILMKNISQSIEGEPLTAGSELLQGIISTNESYFVKKFRDAGFRFMGHTNTPEFALKNITEPRVYGPTRNPWNKEFSPGGSSGGAAAAIASGIVPLAGASDGGGSIRIPASFTSLFGLKPTRGRTPVGPGVGRQWQGASIDFVLSRSVRDSAAMLDILQVVQPEAAYQTPLFSGSYRETMVQDFNKSLRIAFSTKSPVGTPVSEDAKLAVEKLVKSLESEGHHVEEVDGPVDGVQLMKDYYLMNSGEMNATIIELEHALGRELTAEDMEMESWVLHDAGKSVSAAMYTESLSSWDKAAGQMANFHRVYDFYITPATAFTAPRIGELTPSKEKHERFVEEVALAKNVEEQQQIVYDMFLPSLTYTPFTQLANLTGQPAMSVPIYLSEDGLPLGVQVMAQKGEEHRLLQLAYQLEQSDLWVGMKGNPYFGR
ncbi:amidase [Oceanobacillus caeni]|uniref:Amidase n=1 Tax=Oceanobacillus caeni TaxID=405946 RepID=A0ABR5MHM7_9BACI|nr:MULTISPECIES: amidase [Bacillaceae]KKE78934.1 amidase [Bacilli bacterium VT-13-104]PZD86085.1 amidase [Bacilli bacterium]KPH73486.1 amidase [Oceanobacillus caeni]MBU8792472.1 amidase [Oceanobacillus caeni]MCR1833683.1 amidase [Oceanobacillus caeni]